MPRAATSADRGAVEGVIVCHHPCSAAAVLDRQAQGGRGHGAPQTGRRQRSGPPSRRTWRRQSRLGAEHLPAARGGALRPTGASNFAECFPRFAAATAAARRTRYTAPGGKNKFLKKPSKNIFKFFFLNISLCTLLCIGIHVLNVVYNFVNGFVLTCTKSCMKLYT